MCTLCDLNDILLLININTAKCAWWSNELEILKQKSKRLYKKHRKVHSILEMRNSEYDICAL